MKRTIIMILLCFAGSKAFCQTSETLTEEKSSEWIKVTTLAPSATPAKKTSSRSSKSTAKTKKKTVAQKPKPKPAPAESTDEFSRTNSKVGRFSKTKNR